MARMNHSISAELQEECRGYRHIAKRQVYLCAQRRCRLVRLILKENLHLAAALKGFPVLPKKYRKNYEAFKQSFDLLSLQMKKSLTILETSIKFDPNMSYPKTRNLSIEQWEDYRDDLKDYLKECTWTSEQYEKDGFLAILQILDVVERLEEFNFPGTAVQGNIYHHTLEELKKLTSQIGLIILKALHRRRVNRISLSLGDYPPIETTRILSREDDQTTDEIVISRIIEKGYTWKSVILRKAVVIVKTKS